MEAAIFDGLEGHQTDTITNIKLKHVATIVKSLVSVRCPHDALRMNHVNEVRKGDAEIPFLPLFTVDCSAKGVGDVSSLRLGRKSSGVAAPTGNAALDLII